MSNNKRIDFGITIIVNTMILSLLGISIYLSYLGIYRASHPKLNEYCSDSYTFDGYVTYIGEEMNYENYKVWVNIYHDGWKLHGQWFYWGNKTMVHHDIFSYLNSSTPLLLYERCDDNTDEYVWYLSRQHKQYFTAGYILLSIFSIITNLLLIICFAGMICKIVCILVDIYDLDSDEYETKNDQNRININEEK